MTDKKMEIKFAPGCFDNFEGTQEELDDLMKKIQEMFDSGEAESKAIPIEDMLDDMTDEELEQLADQLGIDPAEYMIDEDDVEDIQPQVPSTRTLH
jgi:hypothetical protein